MSREATGGITPTELAMATAVTQAETGRKVTIELEVYSDEKRPNGFLCTVVLGPGGSGASSLAITEAAMVWPCSTHKSVLGMLMHLLYVVQQRHEGEQALAQAEGVPGASLR